MERIPRRILVPTDFSSASIRAVKTAMSLAERFDAEVHPLYVRQVYTGTDGRFLDSTSGENLQDEIERILRSTEIPARKAVKELAKGPNGVRWQGHLERGISIPNTILESARSHDCDLIIMGTHGRNMVSRLLLGSVTERVVRLAPLPMMTTRDNADGSVPPNKMLVGYDSSDDSVEALRFAGNWARTLGSRLVLLHVLNPRVYPEFYGGQPPRIDLDAKITQRGLEALQQAAEQHLTEVEYDTATTHGNPASSIVEYANAHDCDLIVLATHGLTGIAHSLMGSVAESVVRTADVPVLTVRSKSVTG